MDWLYIDIFLTKTKHMYDSFLWQNQLYLENS